MPKIVDTNLQANLLAEAKLLYEKRARLEANLRAADARYDHRIEVAALGEIDKYRIRHLNADEACGDKHKRQESYQSPDDKSKPEAL
jgi:hypothetical protein